VKQDPRVKTPALAMQQVYTLSKAAYYGAVEAQNAALQARRIRDQITTLRAQATGAVAEALADLERKVTAIEGTPPTGGRGRGGRGAAPGASASQDSLSGASALLAGVMNSLQGADVRPTSVQLTAIADARAAAARSMARWAAITTVDLSAVNGQLEAAGLPAITP
jgi:hypothetical protein